MLLRQLSSIIALPVAVIVILPILLVKLLSSTPFWGAPLQVAILLIVSAIVTIGLGFGLLFATTLTFIKEGKGTIAPWDPAKKLIVTGLFSHVRNPMLTGVFLILAGESIVGGSIALLAWTLFFVLGNLLYIPFVEEKSLEERFGEAYLIYKQNVPRWIPRSSAWNPRSRDQKEQVS